MGNKVIYNPLGYRGINENSAMGKGKDFLIIFLCLFPSPLFISYFLLPSSCNSWQSFFHLPMWQSKGGKLC